MPPRSCFWLLFAMRYLTLYTSTLLHWVLLMGLGSVASQGESRTRRRQRWQQAARRRWAALHRVISVFTREILIRVSLTPKRMTAGRARDSFFFLLSSLAPLLSDMSPLSPHHVRQMQQRPFLSANTPTGSVPPSLAGLPVRLPSRHDGGGYGYR
jgi:hypothetical protein